MNLAITAKEESNVSIVNVAGEGDHTVQRDHANDEANRKNHDNKRVDLETRRLVRVKS